MPFLSFLAEVREAALLCLGELHLFVLGLEYRFQALDIRQKWEWGHAAPLHWH